VKVVAFRKARRRLVRLAEQLLSVQPFKTNQREKENAER
jgi:hypothetical protein